MVRSVPRELDTDTMVVLGMLLSATKVSDSLGSELPFLTEDLLVTGQKARGWSRDRARAVLENMSLREGMLWIDEQAFPPRYYSLATLSGQRRPHETARSIAVLPTQAIAVRSITVQYYTLLRRDANHSSKYCRQAHTSVLSQCLRQGAKAHLRFCHCC